jgi:phosphodiesterase/alkaline phosphatase D-like protein
MTWLQSELLGSREIFKVICSSVPFGLGKGRDSWEGFKRERRELLDFIAKHQIENVVVLAADYHYAARHHHRDGIKEFLAGPLTAWVSPTVKSPRRELRGGRRGE